MDSFKIPTSIIIVGSGVFGLSTALALTRRPEFSNASITVIDRSADPGVFPSPDASSIDSSRIIRPDYADPAYATLAAKAHEQWRLTGDDQLGGQGRYHESGMVLIANNSPEHSTNSGKTGLQYVQESWRNIVALTNQAGSGITPEQVKELPSAKAICDLVGSTGTPGEWGYLNQASGWANAEASMKFLLRQVQVTGRVVFKNATVASLERSGSDRMHITGVKTQDGETYEADLVVVAAGAWTGTLVDLSHQAVATGQVLGYVDITEEELETLRQLPVILNLTTGLFVIPPAGLQLKVARHAYGYLNPTSITTPLSQDEEASHTIISVPYTHVTNPSLTIPAEGEAALRQALRDLIPIPAIHERPFSKTRICWYTDTPTGDFLIDYHSRLEGLFLATGGSGHGFKFLPVIGEKIVDCIMRQTPTEFKNKWSWKEAQLSKNSTSLFDHIVTEDGSRGGRPGLILTEEPAR
jgi:sarcosine oxidase / L-pipecolate oxidase